MTVQEFGMVVQLLTGLGVFSGGVGMAAWALSVERRLYKIEVRAEAAAG
jgi:hypothetical protein